MSLRKSVMAAVAAVSLVAVPTMAQAAPAVSKLSVATSTRAGDAETSELGGGSVIIAILAAVAVIAGIIIAADGSDGATSP